MNDLLLPVSDRDHGFGRGCRERTALAQALDRLLECYQVSDPRVLKIVIFFDKARGVRMGGFLPASASQALIDHRLAGLSTLGTA